MKNTLLAVLFLVFSVGLMAQKATLKGVVKDAESGEPLIGANIMVRQGVGTVTDLDGRYQIDLEKGQYAITFSYVGYSAEKRNVTIGPGGAKLDVNLRTVVIDEVKIVADVARSRQTPVAFTNVLPAKISEELGSQDLPMVLNTVPGVYATQQGGGDGDARINIRGFNQRNVAVMLDGIPVNDMENGWVYWSNWFGLDEVTRTIQVQRGLGASRLALPSVGGTLNIITKGITNKREFSFKQEVGNDNYLRTSVGLATGKMPGNWAITAAGSFKRSDGFVDANWSKGSFFYLKIDKILGNHTISISGMGAPQSHGQRSYKKPIATFSKDYAAEQGVDTSNFNYFGSDVNKVTMVDKGIRYNSHWGWIERFKKTSTGDTIHAERYQLSERVNYYHKPQFSLRDMWNVNSKLYVSNILYLSIGNGGGTAMRSSLNNSNYDADGQINFQKFYNNNAFDSNFAIDHNYSDTERKSDKYIRSSENNHFWYGLLSTVNYKLDDFFTLSGGIDLRDYKAQHYMKVYDLLGGDYVTDMGDKNQATAMKHKDDKINYYNDGLVRWGGLFGQVEYKAGNFSAFLNITAAMTGYKKIDYFKPRELQLDDTTLFITYNDTVTYNGNEYTRNSPGLAYNQNGWKKIWGQTFKAGVNYNLTERSNVFMNLGYLSKAPRFNNVFDLYTTDYLAKIRNEFIKAVEVGYTYASPRFSANLNSYYTVWENKPSESSVAIKLNDDETVYGNIQGMNARHVGFEFDCIYKPLTNLELQGSLSLGDWIWTSEDSVRYYNDNNELAAVRYFNAKGVHVGDAAQKQFALSARYEPVRDLYFGLKYNYYRDYYSEFSPESLQTADPEESWKIPAYALLDLSAGYSIRVSGARLTLRAGVINLMDTMYISDATNNDTYVSSAVNSDAQSASVFFGMGRRYTLSLALNL